MTDAALRDARSDDYPVLAGWLPDADSAWCWSGTELRFPLKPAALEYLIEVPDGGSHVLAQADDAPIAFGQFWPTQAGVVQLGRLIVAPGLRRQGLGRRLALQLIEAAVATGGARAITLQVPPNEVPARNLFTHLGFQWVPGESTPDLMFMRYLAR